MPRPDDACPGPCNTGLHKCWDAYEAAVKDHRRAALAAAGGLSDLRAIQEAAETILDVPEPPEPRTYWLGDPIWCARDTAHIRRALHELDMLAAVIEAEHDGHRGAGGDATPTGKRGKGADAPSPAPIVDQLDRLLGYLFDVQDKYREVRNWSPRPTGGRKNRGAQARIEAISWLGVHLDAILRHPGSVRFGKGILAWHRILQKAAHSEPVDERRPGRCRRCERQALRRWQDEYVKCENCGLIMSQEDYEELRDAQLRQVEGVEARAS